MTIAFLGALAVTTDFIFDFNLGLSFTAALALSGVLALSSLGLVAKVAEGVFRRFGLNSIIAYAATGILLGPVLGVVEVTHELSVLLGIGIFVFFFLIGLDEIDISAFVASIQGRFFVAAIVSLTIAFLGALAVTTDLIFDFNLGLSFTAALALSGVLALSSLGLVAKVLSDGGHLRKPVGIQIFTTVIIAELVALLVVGFTIGASSKEISLLTRRPRWPFCWARLRGSPF